MKNIQFHFYVSNWINKPFALLNLNAMTNWFSYHNNILTLKLKRFINFVAANKTQMALVDFWQIGST